MLPSPVFLSLTNNPIFYNREREVERETERDREREREREKVFNYYVFDFFLRTIYSSYLFVDNQVHDFKKKYVPFFKKTILLCEPYDHFTLDAAITGEHVLPCLTLMPQPITRELTNRTPQTSPKKSDPSYKTLSQETQPTPAPHTCQAASNIYI